MGERAFRRPLTAAEEQLFVGLYPEQFIRASLISDSGSFSDLLTANYSFVNRDTAKLYGLSGSFGADLVRTDLAKDQRAGSSRSRDF